ncbi:MAG: peptidase E [Planctomycetota bacterium]
MPTIVVLGGGGFSDTSTPELDDLALSLANVACPRVCFLPTASGDATSYIERFYDAFRPPRAEPSHLGLFSIDPEVDPTRRLLSQHVVYVGGGNTANMLAIWRLHGIDVALRRAWESGVVLCGISAGLLCWFECGVTDSFGRLDGFDDGLGFLVGSACPHYDGEPQRRPSYHRLIERGFPAGYAVDDGAALVFRGMNLAECVSARVGATGYRVSLEGPRVREDALNARHLNSTLEE